MTICGFLKNNNILCVSQTRLFSIYLTTAAAAACNYTEP